jgi:hypothetical protein
MGLWFVEQVFRYASGFGAFSVESWLSLSQVHLLLA